MTDELQLTAREKLAVLLFRELDQSPKRRTVCRWIKRTLMWGLPLAVSMFRQDAADLLQHLSAVVAGAPKR